MLNQVNELSTYLLTLTFRDEDQAPVNFQTARYRIDDDRSKTEVLDWTNIPANGSSTVEIEIPGTLNAIVNSSLAGEIRTVTLDFTYGLDGEGYAVHKYSVMNLSFVPSPVPE